MSKKRKSNRTKYRIHCGYLAVGSIMAMIFCQLSSSPILMFVIGLIMLLAAFIISFIRRIEKIHTFLWWW